MRKAIRYSPIVVKFNLVARANDVPTLNDPFAKLFERHLCAWCTRIYRLYNCKFRKPAFIGSLITTNNPVIHRSSTRFTSSSESKCALHNLSSILFIVVWKYDNRALKCVHVIRFPRYLLNNEYSNNSQYYNINKLWCLIITEF